MLFFPYDWQEVEQDNQLILRAWSLTEQSESVLLEIIGFPALLTVELPELPERKWTPTAYGQIEKELKRTLSYSTEHHLPTAMNFSEKRKLFGSGKYPFLTFHFPTPDAVRHAINILNKKRKYGTLGELQLTVCEDKFTNIRKFLSYRQLRHASWLSAPVTGPLTDPAVRCPVYRVDCHKIIPSSITTAVTPKILAYDIECNSQNIKKFPNKLLAKDVVFIITAVVQYYRRPESQQRYILIFGDCSPIPGATVRTYTSEVAVIKGLEDLIIETDPNLITGYNIDSFDLPYLHQRLLLRNEKWGASGMLTNELTKVYSQDWSSNGAGINEGLLWRMPGRISVDLMKHIRLNYNFRQYKLGFVANLLLGKGKDDVTAEEIFLAYQTQDRPLVDKVVHYGLIDAVRTMELFEKVSLWGALVPLASASGVSIMDIYARGQSVRCRSQLYDICYRNQVVAVGRQVKRDPYAGGYVGECTPGVYEFAVTLDFNSLYPSIIQAYNLCYTTLLSAEDVKGLILGQDYQVIVCPEDDVTYSYYFATRSYRLGLLPQIVEGLVGSRKATRQQMATEKDPMVLEQLDKKQLALKICANSIYGFLGAPGDYMAVELARAVTACGRRLIQGINGRLKDEFAAKIIYGDSVARNTPILVKRNGIIEWIAIENLCEHIRLPDQKVNNDISNLNYEIWSDQGWTKIKRLICHKTQKRMYRVLTQAGCVDVTEDHSLLLPNGDEIRPVDVKVGTKLLHRDLPPLPETSNLTSEEARIWGIFYNKNQREYNKVIPIDVLHARKEVKAAFIYGYLGRSIATIDNDNQLSASGLFHLLNDLGYNISVDTRSDGGSVYSLNVNTDTHQKVSNKIKEIIELPNSDDYVYDIETDNHHFAAGIGRLIVHNTDSVMFSLPEVADYPTAWQRGRELENLLSEPLVRPLRLEMEKVGRIFTIKKKNYIYWHWDSKTGDFKRTKDGDPIYDQKGVAPKRRDKCLFHGRIYTQITDDIMKRATMEQIQQRIAESLIGFMSRHDVIQEKLLIGFPCGKYVEAEIREKSRLNWRDLTFSYRMGQNYTNKNFPLSLLRDRLKRNEKELEAGVRIETLIVRNQDNSKYVGERIVLDDEYKALLESEKPLEIDYLYYLENRIHMSLDGLFQAGYGALIGSERNLDEWFCKVMEELCPTETRKYLKGLDDASWEDKRKVLSKKTAKSYITHLRELKLLLKDKCLLWKSAYPAYQQLNLIKQKQSVLAELKVLYEEIKIENNEDFTRVGSEYRRYRRRDYFRIHPSDGLHPLDLNRYLKPDGTVNLDDVKMRIEAPYIDTCACHIGKKYDPECACQADTKSWALYRGDWPVPLPTFLKRDAYGKRITRLIWASGWPIRVSCYCAM